ncbi:MAG: glycosyltransferase family 2 protein [Armatimonadota bacterium]
MPRVSVVIPSYNYARFVSRAIDSVLAQTYRSLECIVVDDGSTDETPEVLAGYGDRIRTIRQRNQGLSAARNTGLRAATGELVAFLDADDWWEPQKLSRQLIVLGAEPKVMAVGCGEWNIDRQGRRTGATISAPFTGDWKRDLRDVAVRKRWVGGSGSGVVLRREVFETLAPFDTELKAAEDWDMWLRLVARFRVVNLPEILNNRLWHGTGTFRNAARMEENQWRVYHQAVERWPEVLHEGIRRRMRAMILADSGTEYLMSGDRRMAGARYRSSVQQWVSPGRLYLAARLSLLG